MATDVKPIFEEAKMQALEWFQGEVSGLRSSRVKPDLVTSIQVEAYGSRSPLQSVASVSNSDARTLVVSPYDKNTIGDIERAITDANLGVQPVNDGQVIRLVFPSLTDEVRQQTIKLLHNKAEEARVKLRQGRDEAVRALKQQKEAGDATEDDFYDGKKELDELIEKANADVEAAVEKKEQDIATI